MGGKCLAGHAWRDPAAKLRGPDRRIPHRNQATRRILDHYLHTAYLADRLLNPIRAPLPLSQPQPGVTLEPLNDDVQAWDWFAEQRSVLLVAVAHAAATGFDTHAWQLASALWTFLGRRGHWHDWVTVGQTAVAAAGRLTAPSTQAHAHRLLASAYIRLGRFDDASSQLRHALDLATRTGDLSEQARTHHRLAFLWERRGQPGQALQHARQALQLHRATGNQTGMGNALSAIGWFHALLGQHRQALVFCQQALALHQRFGNRNGQAATWDSLGYAHHHLGQHVQAATCYEHALTVYQDLGDRYEEAATLSRLGDTHHASDNLPAAQTSWQQALNIFNDLDHPDAAGIRAKLADPPAL